MQLVTQRKCTIVQWPASFMQFWKSAYLPLLLLTGVSCSKNEAKPVLTPTNIAHVVVGQSSRADVFATLGRPTRTQRTSSGESWIYEYKRDAAVRHGILQSAAAASGVIGAFVPYAGLVGSGLGLAGTALDGTTDIETTSLSVEFGPDGVVHECVYSSTAFPAGVPGAPPAAPVDCQRPSTKGHG
jgi:outer membrane protein assembly factor BamE (lipoprotein component of BamABCDE complex)